MINAKKEFLRHIHDKDVLCVDIAYAATGEIQFTLPVGYSIEMFDQFVNSLDFNYDNGFGSQELFGTIWYTDGTWSERKEYDGSECWAYKITPRIPDTLLTIY